MIPATHMELFLKVHLTNHAPSNTFQFQMMNILKPQNEEINAKRIIPVKDVTYAFVKRNPEKAGWPGIILNSDLCDTGAVL